MIKGLSLWQPWASAMAANSKQIETRSWQTKYRGLIAIHAAKRLVMDEIIHYECCLNWNAALLPICNRNDSWIESLPFGSIVAIGNLTDIRPTDSFTNGELDHPRNWDGKCYCTDAHNCGNHFTERMLGDYSLGRFGWIFEDIKLLPEPIPFRGSQNLFTIPDAIEAEIFAQLNKEIS